MKRIHIATLVIAAAGAAAALWAFGLSAWGLVSALNVAVIIGIAGVVVDRTLVMQEDKRQGFAVKDERTTLVEGKAGKAAFQIGNYGWLALLYYEFLAEAMFPWPKIGTPNVIVLGLLIQTGVYFAARYMYGKSVRR